MKWMCPNRNSRRHPTVHHHHHPHRCSILHTMLGMAWWRGPVRRVGVAAWWWGLAFHVGVAPRQGLCVAGRRRGGPCMPCWDGVTAGLACGKSASWVDLAHSDGVAVAADLHMAKMEAARLACGEAEAAAGT